MDPETATEDQKWWIEKRAEAQEMRDQAAGDGAGHRGPGRADRRAR